MECMFNWGVPMSAGRREGGREGGEEEIMISIQSHWGERSGALRIDLLRMPIVARPIHSQQSEERHEP